MCSRQRSQHQPGQNVQQRGLAAALGRRAHRQPGRHEAVFEDVSVSQPESRGSARMFWHHHVTPKCDGYVVEHCRTIHPLWPRLGHGEVDGAALLGLVVVFDWAGGLHKAVEDRGANAQAFCRGLALAFVGDGA